MEQSYYIDHWNKWPFPVIRVVNELNPFKNDNVEIFIALAGHLPYENIKFITLLGLLTGAMKAGALKNVHTLVEATSGNTGVVLATMAKSFGILRVKLVVAPDVPEGKRLPLIMAGADLIPPQDGMSGIATARMLGTTEGCLNLDQYADMAGTRFHTSFTGPKIMSQMENPPTVFVAGVGTGGTLIGISKHLRRRSGKIKIVGVLLRLGQEIPGVRDLSRMKEITLPWRNALDELVEVESRPSYLASLWFNWSMGLTLGPSSGFAYIGALKAIMGHKKAGTLDNLRGDEEKVRVVILSPDGNRAYGDRFTANLPTDYLNPSKAPLPWEFSGSELW